MELRVLGTVDISIAGRTVQLGQGKELAIITVLGLAAGRPVSTDVLGDQVWDGVPPGRTTLQGNVSRIRRKLSAHDTSRRWIVEHANAYRLDIAPEAVDWLRFQRLVSRAGALAAAADDRHALTLLTEALDLWHGDPLTGLQGSWAEARRTSMRKARASAMARWAETALRADPTTDISGAAGEFVAEFPYDERLTCCLMRALHAAGHTSDALAAYLQLKRRIGQRYRTNPGREATALYESLLEDTGPRAASAATITPAIPVNGSGSAPPEPVALASHKDNLHRDIGDFTDRTREIAHLTAASLGRKGVHVLSGMPGVGKSTLAVHTAHRLREAFPDALLYLDLRGYREEPHLEPLEALQELLAMLGVSGENLPPTLDQRAALWRDRISSRRALLVLDDARAPEQVHPLLPGSPECMVLITSRHRLSEIDGARHLQLVPPSPDDAEKIFIAVSGRDRTGGAEDLRTIVELCDRLPLALRLMGTWLRNHPAWSLADLRHRLLEAGDLVHGFPEVGRKLEAVLTLAMRGLSAQGHAAFLRVGIHPEGEFGLGAAAALTGLDADRCELVLEELMDCHLIEETRPHRYRLNGLVTAFARRSAEREIPGPESSAVRHRLLAYYLCACDAADRALAPDRARMPLDFVHTAQRPRFAGPAEAVRWLATERATLMAVIAWAREHDDLAVHGARLVHGMAAYIWTYGPSESGVRLLGWAVRVWLDRGDRSALAHALIDQGRCLLQLSDYDAGWESARDAEEIWDGMGDLRGRAAALHQMGLARAMGGRYGEARPYLLRALRLYRGHAPSMGLATCLNHCGVCDWELGDLQKATERFTEALRLYRAGNDLAGMANVYINHAGLFKETGRHRESILLLDEALALFRRLDDRHKEGVVLGNMGEVSGYKEDHRQALRHHAEALRIHRETGNRRAELDALIGIGAAHLGLGSPAQAIQYFEQAQRLVGAFAGPDLESGLLTRLGNAHAELAREERASAYFAEALAIAVDTGLPVLEIRTLIALGGFHRTRGRTDAAMRVLQRAERLTTQVEAPKESAQIRLLLDSIEMSHGEAI